MTELVITRGLPASGKSTWARAWVKENPIHRAEVNRDHLREMLHGGFVADVEVRVTKMSHTLIETLLAQGVSVVCSDTNLPQRHARDIAKIGRKAGADVRVQDFTDVPLTTCLNRNTGREWTGGYVPPDVIRKMYDRYVKGTTYPLPLPVEDSATQAADFVQFDPSLPTVVLCDIDGTVAQMGDRSPYDYTKVGLDTPKLDVIGVVNALFDCGNGYPIVFMSGRSEVCREATEQWLMQYVTLWDIELHMRASGDFRKDSIVKRELFDRHIRGKYNVLAVFDDRDQVVQMWREELGLTCLQVAYGAF